MGKQFNMAAVVAASAAGAAASSVASADSNVGVTAKEAPVLMAIAAQSAKAFANVASVSKVKGVDAKSVPGIVASLGKKGFVASEPSVFGTLYMVTKEGAEAAKLLA